MIGNRLRELRKEKLLSMTDLGEMLGKSKSTISRYENNLIKKIDLDFIEDLANLLDSSPAYLLGMSTDSQAESDFKQENQLKNILVRNDDMAPDIPEDAWVQVRDLKENEKLTIGGYYYIEFNDQKRFRMVIDDYMHGIGFLPMDLSEQRIAFDQEYVKILGKVVSMKVYFPDE